MARIRTIKPEFPHSESVGRLSRDARLLFIQIWTLVDDSGRARGASRFLASALFPYDDDAPDLIDGWMSELEAEGMVRRYVSDDGNMYLDIPKWNEHQKIDRPSPSKIPGFVESSRVLANVRECSLLDQGPRTGTKDQGPGPRTGTVAASAAYPEPVDTDSGPTAPDDESPVVLEVPCAGRGKPVYRLTQAKVDEFQESFPGVDVLAECRKARQWAIDNPQRRKTLRGCAAFLSRWLGRVQNSARDGPATRASCAGEHNRAAFDEVLGVDTR